jgi:hypothetical protein
MGIDVETGGSGSSRPIPSPSAPGSGHPPKTLPTGPAQNTGERFAEHVLGAAATCRLQPRSLATYLSDLITAHNRSDQSTALVARAQRPNRYSKRTIPLWARIAGTPTGEVVLSRWFRARVIAYNVVVSAAESRRRAQPARW